MRSLVFLVLVVLAFVLVLKFYPSGGEEVAAAPPDTAGTEERAEPATPAQEAPKPRFLTPPAPAPRTEPQPATPVADDAPDWLAGIEPGPQRDPATQRLAEALIHGGPGEVAAAGEAVPHPLGVAMEAFSLAMAGDSRAALDVARGIDSAELGARELELLQAALAGKSLGDRIGRGGSRGPLLLAMEMGLLTINAREHLARQEYAEAARAYSELLSVELEAPWEADRDKLAAWTRGLDEAQRSHRWSRKGAWKDHVMTVLSGESLVALRHRYLEEAPQAITCVGLIREANQIPANAVIHPGQEIRIPVDRPYVLVDLSARWVLYYLGDEVAASFPVAVGRPGEDTPPGDYTVGVKIDNPPWSKVGQEMIPYGDPRNPLGTRWITWMNDGIKTSYGFHGTIDPGSIGQAASDGCVRFSNEDVERLFEILPEGADIHVQP